MASSAAAKRNNPPKKTPETAREFVERLALAGWSKIPNALLPIVARLGMIATERAAVDEVYSRTLGRRAGPEWVEMTWKAWAALMGCSQRNAREVIGNLIEWGVLHSQPSERHKAVSEYQLQPQTWETLPNRDAWTGANPRIQPKRELEPRAEAEKPPAAPRRFDVKPGAADRGRCRGARCKDWTCGALYW